MANNSPRTPVRITFDRPRLVKLGFAEVAEFEDHHGYSVAKGLQDRPFSTVRDCLYLGTRLGDNQMTPQFAAGLVQQYLENGGTFKDLVASVEDALRYSGVIKTEPIEVEDAEGNASARENAPA